MENLPTWLQGVLGGGGIVTILGILKGLLTWWSENKQGNHTRERENRTDTIGELKQVIDHYKEELERVEKKVDDEREDCNAKIAALKLNHDAQLEFLRQTAETNKARIFVLERDNKRLQTLLRGHKDITKMDRNELVTGVRDAEEILRTEAGWPEPPAETEWLEDESNP